MSAMPSESRRRAVSFAEYSELYLITQGIAEPTSFYTEKDKKNFRVDVIRDSRRLKRVLEVGACSGLSSEVLYECIGLEIWLTDGLAKHVEKARHSHVTAVLSEQRRQRDRGICDIHSMSKVAQQTSQLSKTRANKLAVGYSRI